MLRLQVAAGNRATRAVIQRARSPVQRCGATPPDRCSCHGGAVPVGTNEESFDERPRANAGPAVSRAAEDAGPAVSRTAEDADEAACTGYQPGEVEQSRTPEGHLSVDVHEEEMGDRRMLLIADFGVGRSGIKPTALSEPLLERWLQRFASRGHYDLRIEGITDCVTGSGPDVNRRLRDERASAVRALLDPATAGRAEITDSGDQVYVRDNSSIGGRAANRSAIIEIRVASEVEHGDVSVEQSNPDQVIEHARRVYRRLSPRADEDWTFYGSLTMLQNAGVDDRYIDGNLWVSYGAEFAQGNVKHLREEVVNAVNPYADDEANYRALMRLARQIERGISYGLTANVLELCRDLGCRLPECHAQIIRWMKGQQQDASTIYSTWSDSGVRVGPAGASLGWATPC